MKNKDKIIQIVSIIAIIVIVILIIIFSLSYKINSNNNYNNKIIDRVKKNFSTSENIKYINIYDNYYILKTNDKVYVLDNKYKEVYKEELNKLASNTKNYELIYKNNKLMYENTIRSKNSVTYEYYDCKTYKKTKVLKLER